MIHHCDVVATPRRVTVIPAVPAPEQRGAGKAWVSVLSALGLLISLAVSLGAQGGPRSDSTAKVPTRSIAWTSDRRTFAVGDIIKVIVDEYAMAEANKDNSSSASRRRSMNVGIKPPKLGTASGAIGDIQGSVESGDAGTSKQRGNATRDTRYAAEIPVRVLAVTPEGLLQVKGTKLIDVDKNKQTLMLSGFIRPLDVSSQDMIGSDAIADVQLSYQSKGSLGKPKNGIITKLLGLFWP